MRAVRVEAGVRHRGVVPAHLAGTALPEGDFILSADDHRRFAEAVGCRDTDTTLVALWVLLSGLRGFPMTLADLFALAGCDMEADGPMLGGCELEIERDVIPGRRYRASGEILSIERKSGARAGAFDLMRVRLSVADGKGPVGSVVASYILPRRSA